MNFDRILLTRPTNIATIFTLAYTLAMFYHVVKDKFDLDIDDKNIIVIAIYGLTLTYVVFLMFRLLKAVIKYKDRVFDLKKYQKIAGVLFLVFFIPFSVLLFFIIFDIKWYWAIVLLFFEVVYILDLYVSFRD